MQEDLRRLKKDMWFGNGLPGMTTRMKTAEDRLDNLEKYNEVRDTTLTSRMNLMIGALFSLAAAVVSAVVVQLLFKH